jgi:signal peptidase II
LKRKQLLIVCAFVLVILIVDQAVKIWVKSSFDPNGDPVNVFGDWFRLYYIENQGMAFGTTFGASIWSKLGLSIFRIFAICGIGYYFLKQLKKGVKTEFLLAIGLIFAGATGNLIDSACYDFIFPYDPCFSFNHLEGSGVFSDCGIFGRIETRHTGFLLGNVVDMFQFTTEWPSWVPWYDDSGIPEANQIFPAIWNVADAAISIGVVMVIIRQRSYFPKEDKKPSKEELTETNQTEA